jgi:hypothetical protein
MVNVHHTPTTLKRNYKVMRLNVLQHTLLELPLDLLALVVGARLAVQGHQSTEVELRCLQQLDLADVYLMNSVSSSHSIV